MTFFNEMAEFPHIPIKNNNIQRNDKLQNLFFVKIYTLSNILRCICKIFIVFENLTPRLLKLHLTMKQVVQ